MRRLLAILLVALTADLMLQGQTVPSSIEVAPPNSGTFAPPATTTTQPKPPLSFGFSEGVGRGDDLVVLPVSMGARTFLFAVDTGSPVSIIDKAVANADHDLFKPLGSSGSQITLSGTKMNYDRCIVPQMVACGTELRNASPLIQSVDLTAIREQSGRPIEGILGMDVLENYVIHLDSEHRKLELIDPHAFRPPADDGATVLPIEGLEQHAPKLAITIAGQSNVLVHIDTGNDGAFCLSTYIIGTIVGSKPDVHDIESAEASGFVRTRRVLIPQKWILAGVAYENLSVMQSSVDSWMGLEALCNYDVICDFPGRRVFLRALRDKFEPSVAPHYVTVIFRNGQVIIHIIREEYSKADLRVGDQLVAIDGKPVKELQLWQIRDLTTVADTRVFSLRRGDSTFDVTLHKEK